MYHGTNVMYKSKPWKHVYPDNTPEICDAFPETHKYFWVNMRQTNVYQADIGWLLNSKMCPRISQRHVIPETVNQVNLFRADNRGPMNSKNVFQDQPMLYNSGDN